MQVLTAPASFGHSDCERIVGAALAQPVLAVTSLAYVAAGMAVLCWAMRLRAPLAGTAGVALVAVGAGSFAYHGPQPSWAELAHDWPIIAAGAVYAAGLAGGAGGAVGLGGSGRGLRAGTGRLRRRTHRVAALPTRQPLAVPRRLARPLWRCRRMGRPCHGAGPAREGRPARLARLVGHSVGPVDRSPADGFFVEALESSTSIRPGDRRRRITAASRLGEAVEESCATTASMSPPRKLTEKLWTSSAPFSLRAVPFSPELRLWIRRV